MKNKEKIIGSIVAAVVFISFLAVGTFLSSRPSERIDEDIFVESSGGKKSGAEGNTAQEPAKSIKVQIKGEVEKPGVYSLMQGSRVEELIQRAGGFTEKADRDSLVSLAKKLRDEDCIIVKRKPEPGEVVGQNEARQTVSLAEPKEKEKININTASKEQLKEIPGVGDALAQRIIDHREKRGDFQRIEDLKQVSGIGEKSFDKMKDSIEAR